MSFCQECGKEMGTAKVCPNASCGWIKGEKRKTAAEKTERKTVVCCVAMCGYRSVVRVKTPEGWADFCLEHYDNYFALKAEKACAARGIDTQEKVRIDVMGMAGQFFNLKQKSEAPPMREPGED